MTWRSTRLKYLAALPITNGLGEAAQDSDPSWPRYIRTTDIASPRHLHADRRVSLPPETARPSMVQADDLLMCAAGSLGKVYLHRGDEPACYAGYLVRFRPNLALVDPRFVAYWAESQSFLSQIAVGAVRSTIDNFSAGKYQQMELDVPALDEQRRIADFLDGATSRIDRLIALRRQQIALHGERRQALVSRCVSGPGVDKQIHPTLGTVEQGTEILRLQRVLRQISVGVVVNPSSYFVDAGVPFVHGYNVRDGWLDLGEVKYLSKSASNAMPRSRLRAGDVLVVRAGYPGRAAVVPPELEGGNCASVLVLRCSDALMPEYLAMFFNAPQGRGQVKAGQYGAAQEVISAGQVVAYEMPVPGLEQQRSRLRALEQDLDALGRSSERLSRSCDLLSERRTALVTATVTGELDVTTAQGAA